MDYPESKRGDTVDVLHGVEVADPFRWMEELDSDDTRAWIEAQNALTFGFLAKLPKRAALAERLTKLWDYPKHGVPFRRGDRYFVTHNDGLQNQSVLYWMDSPDGEMRVLIDPNTLTDDGTMALTGYSPAEDGKLLAYGVSDAGSDWQEWRVRDVETGEDLDDHIRWVKFSGASWLKDGSGFFYSRYDEPVDGDALKNANYNQKLYFHKLGTPQSEDELVYERPDEPEWGFGGHVTHDGRYLVITAWWGTHRENALFFKDLTDPDGEIVELLSGFDAGYHFIGNDGGVFYMSTDLDAPMSRLIAIDVDEPETIREVIPESEDSLRSVSFIGGKFLVSYLHDAYSVVKVFAEDGTYERDVDLPGLGMHGGFWGRPDDREAYYFYTSFTVPSTIFHYEMAT
ncbi:MAG TPA: S9 family peptidase, partial [Armatimonadota bacterium]|nr:S9 family peptidase [Armatimonadota bacterium]